jgi:hypothetical protein
MKLFRLNAIGGLFLAAILSAPAGGATPALPGALNYVEGQVTVGSEPVTAKSVGSVELQPGEALTTQAGKAEILLTPGVFVRAGDNSSITMISSNLTNTEVGLDKGTALVEVAEIYKENLLRVKQGDATTQMLKTGLYEFDADHDAVRVFKGEAMVQADGQNVTVKGGHELDLNNGGQLKSRKFDKDSLEQSDLYRFSSLRSGYLAEANVDAARIYVGGPGWYGAGWYWDPMFLSYTWIPGSGMFYSPFGWGFYSPAWVFRSPYYGGYYRGYGRGPVYAHAPYVAGHPVAVQPGNSVPHAVAGSGHSFGVMGGGFHGGGFGHR